MFNLFKNKSEEVSGRDPRTEPITISSMYIPVSKVVYLDVVAVVCVETGKSLEVSWWEMFLLLKLREKEEDSGGDTA